MYWDAPCDRATVEMITVLSVLARDVERIEMSGEEAPRILSALIMAPTN
jgi:hypothetical protein